MAISADVAAMSGYGPSQAAGPHQHQWSPYVMNSGTVMAICGKDFAVIAADTRMSVGYQIQSRNVGKLFKVTDQTVLGTGGHCQADTIQLQKLLRARMVQYQHQNGRTAKTSAIAQLVSQMLYGRRFFPLLTKNIVAGLDEDGARRARAGCKETRLTAC
jgi:20S proteasome subunit beta 6